MKKITFMAAIILVMASCGKSDQNPLLTAFDTPHQTPPFDKIKAEHYEPAFDIAIEDAKKEVARIAASKETPTFENTIVALDNTGERLEYISSIFFNLNSAMTDSLMQDIAQKVSPKLTAYGHEIYMNQELFNRVKQVYEQKEKQNLNPEQHALLEKTWKAFIKGGANLEGADKERFKEVSIELSKLSLTFDKNELAETNAFELHVTTEEDLSGLPEGVKEMAAITAKQKGKEGWIFTLHYPSFAPFMKYADNRKLREQMYRANSSRGYHDNEYNNEEIIKKITALRLELAQIMGYKNYAEYALTDRMANTPEIVNNFIEELHKASHPASLRDKKEVEEYARKAGLKGELQRWDWAYYSNKLMQEKYALDDEMLKPYFKLENVQSGIFDLANQLYGITFREVHNIPLYHKEVKTFEVYDTDSTYLGVLYLDFFPRESKGGGAWMTEFRGQKIKDGKDSRPLISMVMNFTKPTETKPSLLSFNEVTTFLHEFGHAMHGMLSKCTYGSTSGTNVYRDFVELPSQIMENWALEKEWLDTWAVHYQTGERLPQEYIDKIKKSANFQSGYASDRQLSFAMVDMAWHTITQPVTEPLIEFENRAMGRTEIMPAVKGSAFSTAFGHIFAGGYAAGYYGYKWAEVLDADAFSVFKKNGIFDKKTATSFRKNILEKGGSENPMILYKRFRGQEPTVDALLERSGLK
ncbi:peptidase M3 [Sanguibacteroides justesenii]|uniref:Peptidase M3 n=2 Tax=Porphyromonadaceae TaxID=171551 RepID=A0A0C3NFU7_9PORP|nr:peptidase M3 [Sanguibacteroides justesenii]